jgi:hypothetical protein
MCSLHCVGLRRLKFFPVVLNFFLLGGDVWGRLTPVQRCFLRFSCCSRCVHLGLLFSLFRCRLLILSLFSELRCVEVGLVVCMGWTFTCVDLYGFFAIAVCSVSRLSSRCIRFLLAVWFLAFLVLIALFSLSERCFRSFCLLDAIGALFQLSLPPVLVFIVSFVPAYGPSILA